jgi:hypothetical protein
VSGGFFGIKEEEEFAYQDNVNNTSALISNGVTGGGTNGGVEKHSQNSNRSEKNITNSSS